MAVSGILIMILDFYWHLLLGPSKQLNLECPKLINFRLQKNAVFVAQFETNQLFLDSTVVKRKEKNCQMFLWKKVKNAYNCFPKSC